MLSAWTLVAISPRAVARRLPRAVGREIRIARLVPLTRPEQLRTPDETTLVRSGLDVVSLAVRQTRPSFKRTERRVVLAGEAAHPMP